MPYNWSIRSFDTVVVQMQVVDAASTDLGPDALVFFPPSAFEKVAVLVQGRRKSGCF